MLPAGVSLLMLITAIIIIGLLLMPAAALKAESPANWEIKDTIPANIKSHIDTTLFRIPRLPEKLLSKPLLRFKGVFVSYNFNYRSNIDTPFSEKNIAQHNVNGSFNLLVGNILPLNVIYWLRKSNSELFRDAADVQVQFDATGFRNNLINNTRKRLIAVSGSLKDSLTEKLYALKSVQLDDIRKRLQSLFTAQKLRECNEIIQVPSIVYDVHLPDSINRKKADSMQQQAKQFLALYDSTINRYNQLKYQTDSLRNAVKNAAQRVQEYRQTINGQFDNRSSYIKWKDKIAAYQTGEPGIPDKFKWLMGIRNFSVGRSPVNYSELTAKNISVNGINFEYNSWYYLAVAAGVVDYRFRDFIVNGFSRTPQYLYMIRAGIGQVEHNYFIASAFKGQKQIYATAGNTSGSASVNITGFSLETKWQVHRTTSLIAEVSESISPDYRSTPPKDVSRFTFSDKTNKALSLKLYSVVPHIGASVQATYKYTGANYQSFSSFQTNAALKSWSVKWDQPFFNRQLRITGALRSNEFTNPYIVQNYKSNTVFKSINVIARVRRWPTIVFGYVPTSQLTVIEGQVAESRFQTLVASISHFYRIGRQRAITSIVYNKFYNNSSDTGFLYFNAVNLYAMQQFVFGKVNINLAVSHSKSGAYTLNVLDENIHWQFSQKISAGCGVKINNLNYLQTANGFYGNIGVGLSQKNILILNVERGYLPGSGKQLVRNDMGNVQYTRMF